ncbi:DUF1616 domain-containing protein [Halorussus gelatinilyticus]|uniref:DUF1616 domain-containing protein n=1 Tax=Halorussus gelatinilyticus TaxID=2937524 RepID=A0A8U0II98_9EURY|nr:DUF1616 domain-containing protein [Halorussus gelatinilyticus]UPW00391.1 DUF1616 domain-containing protein [Halorussus gelatinilyticus]
MSHETPADAWIDRLARPQLAADLLAVVGYVALAVVVLSQPGVYGTPLAAALGLPLLFFAPGYALVSALFPGATPDDARTDVTFAEVRQHGLSGAERLALGFGVSLALLPLLAVALSLSPWSIVPATVLLSVAVVTALFAVVGAARRLRRPADRRFSLPVRAWLGDAKRSVLTGPASERALNVGLALGVLLAVGAMGYAVAAPGPGQQYTGVALLSQNETGQLVADDYPSNFTRGESKPLVVELTNHEGERTDYSVVVELQRVRNADGGAPKVVQDRKLATFTPTVGAGRTWQTTHEVTPTMTGENLRLTYLVYEGDPPQNPTTENAYRHVHVWVNVTA